MLGNEYKLRVYYKIKSVKFLLVSDSRKQSREPFVGGVEARAPVCRLVVQSQAQERADRH